MINIFEINDGALAKKMGNMIQHAAQNVINVPESNEKRSVNLSLDLKRDKDESFFMVIETSVKTMVREDIDGISYPSSTKRKTLHSRLELSIVTDEQGKADVKLFDDGQQLLDLNNDDENNHFPIVNVDEGECVFCSSAATYQKTCPQCGREFEFCHVCHVSRDMNTTLCGDCEAQGKDDELPLAGVES